MPMYWTFNCFFRLHIYSILYIIYCIFSSKLTFKSWILTSKKKRISIHRHQHQARRFLKSIMHQHHTLIPRCEHPWFQTPEFQVKRKICAEDHCRVVEGDEECHDKVVETAIEVLRRHVKHCHGSWEEPRSQWKVETICQVPEETCSMAPEKECKNVTTSIPQVNDLVFRNIIKSLFSPAGSSAGVQTGARSSVNCPNPRD